MLKLDDIEARVLGVLMEKEKTTPEYYPLTLNAATTACNQKTSRHPIMQLEETEVQEGLDRLKKLGLVAHVVGGGSRSIKYRHTTAYALGIDTPAHAALCLLLLRGPLTPGEINSMSGRIYDFADVQEVLSTLEGLRTHESPMVRVLAKKPGQKEARYMHTFFDREEGLWQEPDGPGETNPTAQVALEQRIIQLEARVEALEQTLQSLQSLLD